MVYGEIVAKRTTNDERQTTNDETTKYDDEVTTNYELRSSSLLSRLRFLSDLFFVAMRLACEVKTFAKIVELSLRNFLDGMDGLIHISEFDDTRQVKGAAKEEKIELTVGETYPMKIIKLAPEERKIGLSIRALKSDAFRADWEAYQENADDGATTLGDHFRNK